MNEEDELYFTTINVTLLTNNISNNSPESSVNFLF